MCILTSDSDTFRDQENLGFGGRTLPARLECTFALSKRASSRGRLLRYPRLPALCSLYAGTVAGPSTVSDYMAHDWLDVIHTATWAGLLEVHPCAISIPS